MDKVSVNDINDVKPEHVSGYISSLVGFAPKTVATIVSILRCFFSYLYMNEMITFPLTECIPKVENCIRTTWPKWKNLG